MDYKEQKTVLHQELARIQQLHETVTTQLTQAQMDEQRKSARNQLAQKVVDTGKLSAEMVDALIERVYVYVNSPPSASQALTSPLPSYYTN